MRSLSTRRVVGAEGVDDRWRGWSKREGAMSTRGSGGEGEVEPEVELDDDACPSG